RVEPVVEIVVVCGIAPRAHTAVELCETAPEVAHEPTPPRPRRHVLVRLTRHDGKDVRERARLHDNAALQISFPQFYPGIEEDAACGRSRGEADRSGRPGPVPEGKGSSSRTGDPEISGADQPSEYQPKQPIHRPPPTRSTIPPLTRPVFRLPSSARTEALVGRKRS